MLNISILTINYFVYCLSKDDDDDENGLRIKEEGPNTAGGVVIGVGNSSPSGGLNLSSAANLKIEEVGMLDGNEPEKLILVVTGN